MINGAPSSSTNPNPNCAAALTGATTCGDITAFSVNATTGRMSLIQNAQVTAFGGGVALAYFPIPANPVDFLMAGGSILTLNATTATASNSYPYTGGATVFPYSQNSSNGQLTASQNNVQKLNIAQGTAIVAAGGYVFVLDNEPPSPNPTSAFSQMLAYTVGSGGALLAANPSVIPDDPNQYNPVFLVQENKGKWFYVANQGSSTPPPSLGSTAPQSGIAGYIVNSPFQPTEMSGLPVGFGSGSGPQCLVEDPSNQFFYTANFNDNSVTGQAIDENAGTLIPLNNSTKAPAEYSLAGPPTWCLMDARTN
jgi:hypothetical protein